MSKLICLLVLTVLVTYDVHGQLLSYGAKKLIAKCAGPCKIPDNCLDPDKDDCDYDMNCLNKCGEKILERKKRAPFDASSFMSNLNMDIPELNLPEFTDATPFPQLALGESASVENQEQTQGDSFNIISDIEKFVPNKDAIALHPKCIAKYLTNDTADNCQTIENCKVDDDLKEQIVNCSRALVVPKGYFKKLNHTENKSFGKNLDQKHGFRNILTKAGMKSKQYNKTKGGNMFKKLNSTQQYSKDLVK